jgi:putative DNA primase/helicase
MLRRVDPSEIQGFLESIGVASAPSSPDSTPQPESGIVLDPNAVAPAAKLARLLEKSPKFKRTWERKRGKDLTSPSEYDMALASFARRAGWSDQEIINLLVQHRREGGDTEKIGRLDYYVTTLSKVARKTTDKPSVAPRGQVIPDDGRTDFNLTDAGNAERLVSIHGNDMLTLAESWHLWDGKRFRQDDLRALDACAIHTARSIFEQAEALEAEADRIEAEEKDLEDSEDGSESEEADRLRALAGRMKDWARRSESRRGIEAMIAVARHLRAVHADDLDADPMLFNCANGTLDLRSGLLRPHMRANRITKLAPTPFDPNARSEALERFLDDLTCGDRSLRDWLGKLLGYILIGERTEDIVALFLGAGGSGKSTLFSALVETLGDYAVTVSFDAFLERDHRGGPRPELAMCRGARAVFAAEVSEGVKLDSAVLKSITGGERITARMLYANPITFPPQFVPLLACNVAPLIEDDSGNRRRLRIVPCDNEVKNPDTSLREDLRKPEARAALLAFLVQGFKRWRQEGLSTCQAVEDATAAYWAGQKQRERERSSKEARATVEVFFGACVEHVDGVVTPSGVLYAAYVDYCAREAIEPVADSVFGRVLGALKLPSTRSKSTRSWIGVRLRDFGGEGDR